MTDSTPSRRPSPSSSANRDPSPEEVHVPRPWQPRYRTPFMLLVMLTMSIMAASGYYLNQAIQGGVNSKMMFVMFTLTSPVISVVVLSLGYSLFRLLDRS